MELRGLGHRNAEVLLMAEMVPPSYKLECYCDWRTLELSHLVWSSSMLGLKSKEGARGELWVLNDAPIHHSISLSQLRSAECSPKMCRTQEGPGLYCLGNRPSIEVGARIREDIMITRVTFCRYSSHLFIFGIYPSCSGDTGVSMAFLLILGLTYDSPVSQRDARGHVAKAVHLSCDLLCPSGQAPMALPLLSKWDNGWLLHRGDILSRAPKLVLNE